MNIFSWCRRRRADVIFLQETHSSSEIESKWKNEWGNKIVFSHGKTNARGVCILISKGVADFQIKKEIIDTNGRFIINFVTIEDEDYVLVNVYGPNDYLKSVDFFKKLTSVLQTENVTAFDKILMGGDFNYALNPLLDRRGTSTFYRPK